MLANFAKVGLDYPTTSLVSTRSTIKNDRETVKRFLMAYSEAVDRLFRDKELAIKVIGKWTRTKTVKPWNRPTNTPPTSSKDRRGYRIRRSRPFWCKLETDPKAKGRRADEFMDPSIYNELEKSGYFKSLGQ